MLYFITGFCLCVGNFKKAKISKTTNHNLILIKTLQTTESVVSYQRVCRGKTVVLRKTVDTHQTTDSGAGLRAPEVTDRSSHVQKHLQFCMRFGICSILWRICSMFCLMCVLFSLKITIKRVKETTCLHIHFKQ